MITVQLLALLLALSVALNVGVAACLLAYRAGTALPGALLVGGGALGGVMALFLSAVSAYR